MLTVCTFVVAFLFALPVCALAGNVQPRLWLEVNYQADDPTDPDGPGFMVNPCVHQVPPPYPFILPCYAPRLAYNFYIVPIHVSGLDRPICQTTGALCAGYGGYLGLGFGAQISGTGMTFMNWNACPGFLKGPSAAGEPAAMLASSTAICHDWYDHEGYMIWMNLTGTTARYMNIVASADLGHYKLINCHSQYDEGTTVGGGIQIGGTQTIVCGGQSPVEEMTWGEIKALYR
jgi:hypothetical protein